MGAEIQRKQEMLTRAADYFAGTRHSIGSTQFRTMMMAYEPHPSGAIAQSPRWRGQVRERVCDALDHRPRTFVFAPGIEGCQRRRCHREVSGSCSEQTDDLIDTEAPGGCVRVHM